MACSFFRPSKRYFVGRRNPSVLTSIIIVLRREGFQPQMGQARLGNGKQVPNLIERDSVAVSVDDDRLLPIRPEDLRNCRAVIVQELQAEAISNDIG